MAHDLTRRVDGFVEMAWHGATPWHGLGQEMPAGASMADWQKQAGMDWSIERADVEFTPAGHPSWGTHLKFDRRQVLYRSDTYEALGVVSKRYQEVQPGEVMDFFSAFMNRRGFAMSAAGTMRKGAVLWATAQTGHAGQLKDGDELRQYLLMSTSCDGTSATELRLTQVRVVCANTLAVARQSAPGLKITHSVRIDPAVVKQAFGAIELGNLQMPFDEFMVTARRLAQRTVTVAKASEYLVTVTARMRQGFLSTHFDAAACLAQQRDFESDQKLKQSLAYQTMLALFEGQGRGADLPGSRDTAWGLLNAVTEYVDHHNKGRHQNPADRYHSAWLGRGQSLKSEALALADLL
jgi:phage/plasmid-like protein (TIGR03299 family)